MRLRIRPEIFDFEPELGLKRSQIKPKMPSTAPTDRHTAIPTDSGPIAACFDDDPKKIKLRDSSAEQWVPECLGTYCLSTTIDKGTLCVHQPNKAEHQGVLYVTQ